MFFKKKSWVLRDYWVDSVFCGQRNGKMVLGSTTSTSTRLINFGEEVFYSLYSESPNTPWKETRFQRLLDQTSRLFFSCFWTIKHFDLSLITFPLPSLGHLITKGKVAHWNLGNSPSNMGSATEFRQFNFNYRLGYITYVRLYHHAGNDIH